ncbi:hypothetical protein [Methylicorpusculum sp.]|uniref:hypothetical protein n=1 Tax=Methylicorpusculum sp. TaxID=2713644 RepID=UPI002AB8167C|nr:hypothetical protein [Methylicorpusculum sp.]MDZ4153933.1 hypothetical protein [Methylicorpusculum sp.]
MKKTMYHFSLVLLMALNASTLAMNNQPDTSTPTTASQPKPLILKQQEPELTGLAHLVDRSGTLAQYCLVPATYGIKTGDIPGTVALAVINAITSNLFLLLLGGKKSKLKPFAHTDTETAAQFAARSGANSIIHLTNQGIKILAGTAPLLFVVKITRNT